MYLLRRWWDRSRQQVVLWCLVLAIALGLRHTQGFAIFEAYHWLTRPFQTDITQLDYLTNARVLELQSQVVELENQNRRLRELLGYSTEQSFQGVIAPIIGRSADHWWEQLLLGQGYQDNIQPGAIVMGVGGLVGEIVGATLHTSRVLLISDPSSRVGVTVSRSRAMGFLRGQGSDRAVMRFFDPLPDVAPGDVVVTSTLSQRFPAGVPVGWVESVNLQESPVSDAVVVLSAPIGRLEWVMVHSQHQQGGQPTPVSSQPGEWKP